MSTETIIPEVVTQVASDIQGSVPPALDTAKQNFDSGDVEGTAFSDVGMELAGIFPSCREWMLSECEKKSTEVDNLVEKMNLTAQLWGAAESNSTIFDNLDS